MVADRLDYPWFGGGVGGGILRRTYLLALAALAGVAVTAIPVSALAAPASSADRARIALLVYQSQSARQVDLRRGDAATRELRARADGAERLATVTRAELLKARAEGTSAKKRAQLLEQRLEEQERSLAEAAEKYTAELAKRDADYARERSILISTGERLLKTPEGRRVLDLYNSGGEANWKEAKAVLDQARRVRRALDTRDAAVMYAQARAKGLETTGAVIVLYEELLRDDPSRSSDWLFVSILYRESGAKQKAVQAAETAARLASGEVAKVQTLVEVARARRSAGDVGGALAVLGDAEKFARNYLASNPRMPVAQLTLAGVLLHRGSAMLEKGDSRSAREAYQESVQRYEALHPAFRPWPVKEHHLSAMLGLANSYWNEEEIAKAAPYIRKAHAFAREALSKHAGLTEAREKVALTSSWMGDLLASEWTYGPALALYREAQDIYQQLTKEDPGLAWYDQDLEYLGRAIAGAELELNRNASALDRLERSEAIARKHSSIPFRSALQAGLRRQGVALAALDRDDQAQQRWSEALATGRALFESELGSHSSWARIEQASVLLDMADLALEKGDIGRGLGLVSQAENLYGSERRKLPRAATSLGLTAARLKGELTAAGGDMGRARAIFESALADIEGAVRNLSARIEVRFGRADLALSMAKLLLATEDRTAAIEKLRLAHRLLRALVEESDSAEVHRTYANAVWLMADNQVDQSSWGQAIRLLEELKQRGYANRDAEKLLAEARSKAGRKSPPVRAK